MSFFEKLFGSFSDKELKRINPLKDKVLALEPEMAKLTDEELQAKTTEFKERLAKGETLDDLLPEAFAVCREADWRVLGMKPYPVQIIGGIVLHRACIAEMQTGEGKTLVATMPTYLNALTGEGPDMSGPRPSRKRPSAVHRRAGHARPLRHCCNKNACLPFAS